MRTIQWMTPEGIWLGSCPADVVPPWDGAVPAIMDGEGSVGMEGCRYMADLDLWMEDPAAAPQAAYLYALSAQRAGRAIPRPSGAIARWRLEVAAGEEIWSRVDAYRDDPSCPFAMKRVLASASDVDRDSQMLTELGWLMGVSEDELNMIWWHGLALPG